MSSVSTMLSSASRVVRRNSGKIALLALATGSAVAAVTYLRPALTAAGNLRRQLAGSDEFYVEERKRGARRMRQEFLGTCESTRTCFRGLLKKLHALISKSELLDMSGVFTSLRERPSDMGVKKRLWKQIMVSSYTCLLTSIYTTSLLYTFVCLLMTVLARYNSRGDGIDGLPSEQLPSGGLSAQTSKRLLDLVWRFLLHEERINSIIARIHVAAGVETAQLDLAHSPTIEELSETIQAIVEHAWEGVDEHAVGDENGNSLPVEETCSLRDALHDWLFVDLAQIREQRERSSTAGAEDENNDATFSWLIGECLDICEVLDFKKVVHSNMNIALSYSVEGLRHTIDPLEGGKLPSNAILLSRLRSMGTTLLVRRDGSNMDSRGWNEDLDEWFCNDDVMKQFAASVFVSGEQLPAVDGGGGNDREAESLLGNFLPGLLSLSPFSRWS